MNKLKELRIKQNLTQIQVAKYLNTTHQTYNNYENGKYEPSIDMLIKIADLFHTSVDNLIRDNANEIKINEHPKLSNELMNKLQQLNEYNLMKVEGYIESMIEEQNKRKKENV